MRIVTSMFAAVLAGWIVQSPKSTVPYVSSNPAIVDAMLKLAEVSKRDVVYDLGSSDGRIVIAAAKQYGAHGVGIDIDPALVAQARDNAKAAGVEHLVTFRVGDLFTTDVHDATVVTLYLLPSVKRRVAPRLRQGLKPGAPHLSDNLQHGDGKAL